MFHLLRIAIGRGRDGQTIQVWRKLNGSVEGSCSTTLLKALFCSGAATSHALGAAHVWREPSAPDGGHIVGPGRR